MMAPEPYFYSEKTEWSPGHSSCHYTQVSDQASEHPTAAKVLRTERITERASARLSRTSGRHKIAPDTPRCARCRQWETLGEGGLARAMQVPTTRTRFSPRDPKVPFRLVLRLRVRHRSRGPTLTCLSPDDEDTREFLAIDNASTIGSARVTNVLGRLIPVHGAPWDA